MKQEKINRAHESLTKLSHFNLPVKKAYAIYKLMQVVDDSYQFAMLEEQKYLKEYNGTPSADGTVTFATPDDCQNFKNMLEELLATDADLKFDVVKLSESDLGEQRLTPADIHNLEGFVEFV